MLKVHEAIHSDERKFKCNICPDERTFKTKSALNNHMKYHYELKYSRVQCQKKFYSSSSLNQHVKFHFEPKYSCKCGKKFYTSSDLRIHENIKIF